VFRTPASLANVTTVANIGARGITQMSDMYGTRCYADFRESVLPEVG
jgi:hypothetical protein